MTQKLNWTTNDVANTDSHSYRISEIGHTIRAPILIRRMIRMSNLKALVWYDRENYAGTKSPLHHYDIYRESHDKFCVSYQPINGSTREATGFATIDEAKAWAWNHYNEKMQPYVKPMPTWIDVNERLPGSECFYLVRLFDGHRDEHVFVILWWNAEHQQFLEWDAMCEPTHWMPIPEFSTMQNLHKGE